MAAAGPTVRDAHFPGRAPIDAYGGGGFRFAGMSHHGSLLCLPSGIYGWEPTTPIDAAGLARVFDEADAVGILVIGNGRDIVPLAPGLKARLEQASIVAEMMSTGAAVRTFNVLLAEGRAVAAALVAVD